MKPIIIANWKMNPQSSKEANKLFEDIEKEIKDIKKAEIVICPPFVFLPSFTNIKKGAQDVFLEKGGAFTGEVSPLMLKDLGCEYVIVGHSERRKYFGETDEIINKKIKAALENNLTPIFCVGETEKEKEENRTEEVLKREIKGGLKGLGSFEVTLAYEPIWAIGTGNACEVKTAAKMRGIIKDILEESFGKGVSKTPILYGGSVNSKNAAGYIKEAGFQGLLVGGASLDAKEFGKIVESVV